LLGKTVKKGIIDFDQGSHSFYYTLDVGPRAVGRSEILVWQALVDSSNIGVATTPATLVPAALRDVDYLILIGLCTAKDKTPSYDSFLVKES